MGHVLTLGKDLGREESSGMAQEHWLWSLHRALQGYGRYFNRAKFVLIIV